MAIDIIINSYISEATSPPKLSFSRLSYLTSIYLSIRLKKRKTR